MSKNNKVLSKLVNVCIKAINIQEKVSFPLMARSYLQLLASGYRLSSGRAKKSSFLHMYVCIHADVCERLSVSRCPKVKYEFIIMINVDTF